MALTVPTILHSIYGRFIGLDKDKYVVGAPRREAYEAVGSASTLARTGTSILSGSTVTFTLAAPLAIGIEKELINASSVSTAAMAIVRSTADGTCGFLACTSGSTAAGDVTDVKRLNLINVGAAIKLRSISTSMWAVTSIPASSLYFTISTSS